MTRYEELFDNEESPVADDGAGDGPNESDQEEANLIVNANVNGYLDQLVNALTAWEDDVIAPTENYKLDSAEVRLARIEMIRLVKQRIEGDLQQAREVTNG